MHPPLMVDIAGVEFYKPKRLQGCGTRATAVESAQITDIHVKLNVYI